MKIDDYQFDTMVRIAVAVAAALCFIFAVVYTPKACADALYLHIASHHSAEAVNPNCQPYNESNLGLGYRYDPPEDWFGGDVRFEFGFFDNSCDETSRYIMLNYRINKYLSAVGGFADEYPDDRTENPNLRTQLAGQIRFTLLPQETVSPVIGALANEHGSLITFHLRGEW